MDHVAPVSWALAEPALGDGAWLGISDRAWFWSALGIAVLHQIYRWLLWRAQLGWGE
ncbi:MAG: hypothetical protein ACOCVR_00160 [Myxococcota bacterium]